MAFIADTILASGSFVVAIYCLILSKRLRKFTSMENDIGKAISILSNQIDELRKSVKNAQQSGEVTINKLKYANKNADNSAKHLELLVASLHSLPIKAEIKSNDNPFVARRQLQGNE